MSARIRQQLRSGERSVCAGPPLLDINAAVNSHYPTEFKDEAEYRGPFAPVEALVRVGAQPRMGRAALKYVIEKAPQRAIAYTTVEKQTYSMVFHSRGSTTPCALASATA
ncbi:hypothetical protein [Paraburkholderia dipogonis]|uniref:hypothetical protein n=1 Tax=Paraburkholderia dipogonis TaxID=1211383 RepID=UPI0038B9EA9F